MLAVKPRPRFSSPPEPRSAAAAPSPPSAPITGATEDEMSVSLGTVFVLNSIALLDVSGDRPVLQAVAIAVWFVGGAGDSRYQLGGGRRQSIGAVALAVGTTVKLARALWIVPLSVGTAIARRQQDAHSVAVVHPFLLPGGGGQHLLLSRRRAYHFLSGAGKLMLIITLFLIGASLSPAALRKVGPRPLLQGVLLWIVVAVTSLLAIRAGWIRI